MGRSNMRRDNDWVFPKMAERQQITSLRYYITRFRINKMIFQSGYIVVKLNKDN